MAAACAAAMSATASTARRTGAKASTAAKSLSSWDSSASQIVRQRTQRTGGRRPQACHVEVVGCGAVWANDQHQTNQERGIFERPYQAIR